MPTTADQIALVGFETVQGVIVLLRADDDSLQSQLVCSAKYTDRDFSAVGNKDFVHRHTSADFTQNGTKWMS